mgnify:CR=1 FL=1
MRIDDVLHDIEAESGRFRIDLLRLLSVTALSEEMRHILRSYTDTRIFDLEHCLPWRFHK